MYLLFIILTALCSAVVKTIERNYEHSIFFKLGTKFWHPVTDKTFTAYNVFYVGKCLFICLAIVCAQLHWWQISFDKIAFILQLLLIAVVYAFIHLVTMSMFISKSTTDETTTSQKTV